MPPLFIWGGPVSRSDLDGVDLPPGTLVLTENHGPDGGIGSSSMGLLGQLAEQQGGGDAVVGLCRMRGVSLADHAPVVIAGFSAFHGLATYLLESPSVTGAVMLDACFSAFGSLEKRPYVEFGRRAARGEVLMVLSSSDGGGQTYSTGTACARANYEAAGGVVNENEPLPVNAPGAHGSRTGNLVWLDYRAAFASTKYGQHGAHVHVLGDAILNRYLVPWMNGGGAGEAPPIEAPARRKGSKVGMVLAGAAALLAGFAGVRAWRSSSAETRSRS